MKEISERELELPDAVIGELLRLSAEDKHVINLGPGQPDFLAPKPIIEYTRKIPQKGTHYAAPQGMIELREALCKKVKKENKMKCSPENIIVTCGSQQALFTALATTLDPGDQVVLPNPSYLAYIPQIELISAFPSFFKLREEDEWKVNPDLLVQAIEKKKTKAILINTPSNPCGSVLPKNILEEIADIAVEYDLYILVDEAYEKLVYDKKHISIGSLNGMEDYVVTFQSFSKTYAMCGYRLGYAIGPKEVIDAMNKVAHYITLTAPSISQLVGIKALTLPKFHIEKMRREYDRRRRFIVKRLNEINLPTVTPHGAFYTFSNIKQFSKNSYKFAKELLKKTKVAVIPGTEFGKFGEGYIRCSYATDLKNIKIAMDRLERFLKKKQ